MNGRIIRIIFTIIIILSIVSCLTGVKIYAKERKPGNILPAVDILVIEAE